MNTMRRKADREAKEGPSQEQVEASQKAMGKVFSLFRVVIGVLIVCALGALWMAYNS